MTDVRDGGSGPGSGTWGESGDDLDDLLTRWGSDQTGPFRAPTRAPGRHSAPEPLTHGDDLSLPPTPRHASPEPPTPRYADPRPQHRAAPRYSDPRPQDRPAPRPPDPRPQHRPVDPRPEHPSWPADPIAPTAQRGRPQHPSWPDDAFPPAGDDRPRPSWPAEPAGQRRPQHPSWPADPIPPAGSAGVRPSWEPPVPPAYEAPRPGGRRHRAIEETAAWEMPREPVRTAPNGRPPVAPAGAFLGAAPAPAASAPPRFDDTGAYAGWLSSSAPSGNLLERTPDRYGLLTHDLDGHPEPAAGDDLDDDVPGRHRRPGARPARRRGPRWLRTLRWVAASVAVLLVLGGGVAVYQYKKLSGNINRIDALAPGDASIREAAKQLDAENYLLIGSDTRSGDNGKYEENAGQVSGERSDTTILAHLSPARDKATLISFPRDSWVSLPECRKTAGGIQPAHDAQFNEAFAIGGPACTVLAVQKLTGIKINHYVQVDFTGFKTMVDAVNGVPICTPTPLRDDESGLRMAAGTTVLKGEQALAYVRARYGIGDGSDLGRIERQQRFLGAMVRAATSTKLLVNPVALTKFLGAATKSLTLDRETSFGDLKTLADQLHGLDPKRVSFLTAPIANQAYNPPGFPALKPGQGGSKVLLDDVAGRTLWDSIINDKPQPAPGSSPAPKPTNVLTVAPEEVTVRVVNGVGTGGLAGTVGKALTGVGFSTVEPTNAGRTATTTVRYAPDRAEEAKTLAAAVPGAVLQPDAGTSLDLVIGANYNGVKRVKPGDPATAKAAAAPKPSTTKPAAKPVTAADASCG